MNDEVKMSNKMILCGSFDILSQTEVKFWWDSKIKVPYSFNLKDERFNNLGDIMFAIAKRANVMLQNKFCHPYGNDSSLTTLAKASVEIACELVCYSDNISGFVNYPIMIDPKTSGIVKFDFTNPEKPKNITHLSQDPGAA